jgi:hypothetical protein
MVEVAGLYSAAPALDMIRPAGIAPDLNAQRNFSFHSSSFSGFSTSAKAEATLLKVASISLSIECPEKSFKRYFLSQISTDAG